MASNAELIAAVIAIDADAKTEGLTNAELTKLLKALNAKADADADAKAEAEADEYIVAPGKSITSKRGLLTHGDAVKAEYFGGGEASIEALLASNHIAKA